MFVIQLVVGGEFNSISYKCSQFSSLAASTFGVRNSFIAKFAKGCRFMRISQKLFAIRVLSLEVHGYLS